MSNFEDTPKKKEIAPEGLPEEKKAEPIVAGETVSPVEQQEEQVVEPNAGELNASEKVDVQETPTTEGRNEVTIPLMITKKMVEDLRLKGYSEEEINKLTPDAAHKILFQTIASEIKEKIESSKTERFDNPEYSLVKKSYDPLYKLMEELKVEGVDFTYGAVESLEPAKEPEFEGQVTGNFKTFYNYHDLVKFRNSLTPEQKQEFDSKHWGKEDPWAGITVLAPRDFWPRLNNPQDELYQHRDRILEVVQGVKTESLPDEFHKAVEDNNVQIPEQTAESIAQIEELRQLGNELQELIDKVKDDDLKLIFSNNLAFHKDGVENIAWSLAKPSLVKEDIEYIKESVLNLKKNILTALSEPKAIEDETIAESEPETKKTKRFNIFDKLDKFKENHQILGAFGTAAARMAGNVLGVKILQEGIGAGVGIIREKKKSGGGWAEATKKALAKSSTDLGRFLYGKVDVKERRGKLQETVEGFFEAYRDKSPVEEDKQGERFMTKVKELDAAIKGATYLTAVERQAYRDRLAKTIWEYRKTDENNNEKLRAQVADETNQYIHNKALKYTVARDALNFGLTAVGAGFLRLASFAGFTALQRSAQASREFQHLQGMRENIDEKILEGKGKLNKVGYIAKDVTVNAAWETANALVFQGSRKRLLVREVEGDKGEKKIEYYKGRKSGKRNAADFAAAFGTLGTAFGMASLIGSDKLGQGLSDLSEKISNNWSNRGVMMFVDGFVDNARHMWQTYSHPGEAIAKMRQAIFGSGEEIINDSVSPEVTRSQTNLDYKTGDRIDVDEPESHKLEETQKESTGLVTEVPLVTESKSGSSSIEKEFIRKEHPEVIKDTERGRIESLEKKSDEVSKPELPPEVQQLVKQEIKAGKLEAGLVEAYLGSRTLDPARPPSFEDIQKFSELIKVEKGGSYWSTFMKQFRADPKDFGYEGDLTNKAAIDVYGKRIVVDYAFREGLVVKNADGTLTDVRIKDPNARIIWQFNKDKGLSRVEYQPGKNEAKFETYQHTTVKEVRPVMEETVIAEKRPETQPVETQTVEHKPEERTLAGEKTAAGPEVIDSDGSQEKSHYMEVNLSDQFRGAKSFDHKIHVYAGDLSEVDSEPDGLVDLLRFTDDDDNLIAEIELPKAEQKSAAQLMPEIYRKTQTLDRTLTDLQGLMPKSKASLTLSEQVKVAKLIVSNEVLFEDGAIHDVEDKLTKLDEIFGTHKEYLSDNKLAQYVAKNIDDVEAGAVARLYKFGLILKEKVGFKSADYELLNRYIEDKRPIEFAVGKNGLEYNYLDDDGELYRTLLTDEKVVINAAGSENFDEVTVSKFRTLAEERLMADREEFERISEKVDDIDLTKKILELKCRQLTDTEIAELFPADDRERAHEVFNYLVARVGEGNEKVLDFLGDKTVGEALSDIVQKK